MWIKSSNFFNSICSGAWLVIGVCSAVTHVELGSCIVLSLVCSSAKNLFFFQLACKDTNFSLFAICLANHGFQLPSWFKFCLLYVGESLCLLTLPTYAHCNFAEYEKYRGPLGNVRKGVLVCLSAAFPTYKGLTIPSYCFPWTCFNSQSMFWVWLYFIF